MENFVIFGLVVLFALIIVLTHLHNWVLRLIFRDTDVDQGMPLIMIILSLFYAIMYAAILMIGLSIKFIISGIQYLKL